jgi:hypothetical protein
MFDESPLEWMKLSVFRQSFDSNDRFSIDIFHGDPARSHSPFV